MGTEEQRAEEIFQWIIKSRRQGSVTDRLHKAAVGISKIFGPQKGYLVRDGQVESAIEGVEEPRLEDARGDPAGKGDRTYGLNFVVAVHATAVTADVAVTIVDAQPSVRYYNVLLLALIVYYCYVTPYCRRLSSSSESRFSSSVSIGMQMNTIVNVNIR
jgi:hypothetical protein